MESICCPEMCAKHYLSTLRHTTGERRSQTEACLQQLVSAQTVNKFSSLQGTRRLQVTPFAVVAPSSPVKKKGSVGET